MLIDACVHHQLRSQAELTDYMSRGWREYLTQPANLPGSADVIPILPVLPFRRPQGDKLADTGEPSGSDPELVREQLLDGRGVDRAVLCHDVAMFASVKPNPHLAREVISAINDWTIDRWLSQDPRLYGLVVVPTQTPEDAVTEIERMAGESRMVGVLLAGNGLSKPFGHPVYHPILRAAAEHDLPIVIHAGGDAPFETLSHHTAGGQPATYAEYNLFASHAIETHLVSLVAQGVFTSFPGLRVLVQGTGLAWLPALFWRFDNEYIPYRREVPWLDREPTEYLRDHIRVTTNPLDAPPRPEQLIRLMNAFGGMEDLLMFGSGYPNWDTDWPESIHDRIPDAWHAKVFSENALDLFRWPTPNGS